MVPLLIRRLGALDYPAAKLEILILVEADDIATRAALAAAPKPPSDARGRGPTRPAAHQAPRPQRRTGAGPRHADHRVRRRGQAAPGTAARGGRALRRRAAAARLPPGPSRDRARHPPAAAALRPRICRTVRPLQRRPRPPAPADAARGHLQSFPGSRLARRRWLGCLERHRGCRSRIEAGQVRLRHRRARLGHLRGGAGSPAGLAEAAAALDQGVDAGGAGSRARPLGATRPGSGQRGRGGVDARQPRDRAAGDPAGARAGGLAAMSRRLSMSARPCWRLPCRRSRSSRAYGAAGPGCGPAASTRSLHICRCCCPTSC